jgi:hypothetical protein
LNNTNTSLLKVSNNGDVYGVVKDSANPANLLRMCTGKTTAAVWSFYEVYIDGTRCGAYIDIDTSACGFTAAYNYFPTLLSAPSIWTTVGVTSIYSPTATGFRLYV